MFNRLHTKLTVLYAALFGATLLFVALAVYAAITSNAQRQVRDELAAGGAVFDRVWSLRSGQLREGAALLSRDFGFREAVASGDVATIASAMENLRNRLGVDLAFIVQVDGRVIGRGPASASLEGVALAEALAEAQDPSGVMVLGKTPHQAVAAPILSPDLMGWVVFAVRLDSEEMSALERLSAIPLDAVVLHRRAQGWTAEDGVAAAQLARTSKFVEAALARRTTEPAVLATAKGPSIALVKPLPSLTGADRAVLMLRYSLSQALAPYRALVATIVAAGVLGGAFVLLGSWALARNLTRPISALEAAAHRLQRGEDAHVAVITGDEIGRLAESFNGMAAEIRERERRITHLALHDEETGLPNRLALEQALDGPDRGQDMTFVAALGIDRFAHVRGAIGYALAAQALRMIGNRLGGLASRSRVARLSTDVLGFTLAAESAEAAEAQAARLLAELEHPLQVGGDAIDVSLTLGLAPLPPGRHAGEAVEQANIALDQARAAKRKVAFFDAEAYGDPSSNLSLMSGMLQALEAGEIELHHQPKYDLRRRTVTGAEALVRWRHPSRGMLPPDLFIPMAEETGHIRTLTEWVLRQAVADQRALAAAGHDLMVSVNISGRLLGELDFAEAALAEAAGSESRLCFEITETAVIENPELALSILDRFAEAGISISIDDFGTGLSSLAYLKRIRGHELKIDKALVLGITESQRDALIVRSTIDLAHSLGLKVTAEGVETEAAFSLLAAMGCDNAQGYLIAKPQPLNELLRFLEQDREASRSYG